MEIARRRSDLWIVKRHLADLCRIKNGEPTKFTRTYVQRLRSIGIITVEEHRSHRYRYHLTEYGLSLVEEAIKYGK